jgi:hypothetical protein
MRITTLIYYLIKFLFKYGNREIDILTESHFTQAELRDIVKYKAIQVEQPLSDIAFAPSQKRIKLLPKDF